MHQLNMSSSSAHNHCRTFCDEMWNSAAERAPCLAQSALFLLGVTAIILGILSATSVIQFDYNVIGLSIGGIIIAIIAPTASMRSICVKCILGNPPLFRR